MGRQPRLALQTAGKQRGATRLFPWLLLGAAAILFLSLRLLTATEAEPPLLGTVAEFRLLDQDATSYGSHDLKGRVWIANFIYTTCPGPCPALVERLKRLDKELNAFNPRPLIVSFSVDPEHDSPVVLKAYAKTHGINEEHWKLLGGDLESIVELVRDSFALGLERATDSTESEAIIYQGPVVHSLRLVLVDQTLRIRGYYQSPDPQDLERLGVDLKILLKN